MLQDKDFNISDIVIEKEPYGNEKKVGVTVSLSGSPFGSVKFRNVAINIGNDWYLVSPEPLIAQP